MRGTFDYAVSFPNSKNAPTYAIFKGQVQNVKYYFHEWITGKKLKIKASTAASYQKLINKITDNFGDILLIDFVPEQLEEWFDTLDVKNKTFKSYISLIRTALNDAVRKKIIPINPFLDFEYKRTESPLDDDHIEPFTVDEQKKLIDACNNEMERNQLITFLWTGLRTSELIALTWKDIDFHKGYIRVNKAITKASKGKAELPKTKSGKRFIKILKPTLDALKSQYILTQHRQTVFINPHTNESWNGDSPIRKRWVRLLKRAKVRYRNPYQTRHTYASMMLSAGEPVMWVAQQMGHADWTMVARVYGKWIPDTNLSAGDKAVALFNGTN
nr:site-specific integrase [Pelistega sp. MC2]